MSEARGSLDGLGELVELYRSDKATAMYDEVVAEREHALRRRHSPRRPVRHLPPGCAPS
jgi:hypothetical protein